MELSIPDTKTCIDNLPLHHNVAFKFKIEDPSVSWKKMGTQNIVTIRKRMVGRNYPTIPAISRKRGSLRRDPNLFR